METESKIEGASQISNGRLIGFQMPKCYCNLKSVIRVSETLKNPGKMYFSCPKMKMGDRCGFFRWFEHVVGCSGFNCTEVNSSSVGRCVGDDVVGYEEQMKMKMKLLKLSDKLNNLETNSRRLNVVVICLSCVLVAVLSLLGGIVAVKM